MATDPGGAREGAGVSSMVHRMEFVFADHCSRIVDPTFTTARVCPGNATEKDFARTSRAAPGGASTAAPPGGSVNITG